MRKTKEVDNLLNTIADTLDAGDLPTVKQGVDLDLLLWTYREHENRNTLPTEVGLRIRRNDSTDKRDYKDIASLISYLVLQKIPPESFKAEAVATIKAYTARKITVATLFGERYRKPRLDIPWQVRDFLGELAEQVLIKVKTKDGLSLRRAKPGSWQGEGALYFLLEEVSYDISAKTSFVKTAEKYNMRLEQLEGIGRCIIEEDRVANHPILKNGINHDIWIKAHEDWLSELTRRNHIRLTDNQIMKK